MAPVKPNVKSQQDMPPKGGFPRIGISGRQSREHRKEKREGRMAALPFLMAEQDVEMAMRLKNAEEKRKV